MLADVGADDGVAPGDAIDFRHQVLGFDFIGRDRTIIGMLVHPLFDLAPPGGASGLRLGRHLFFGLAKIDIQAFQHALHVAHNG